ncbi:hypothetical protein GCM10023195_47690 [Actinoallomurus liliacearum]|uniref:Uncharacterized protein n=1 Tax=Actinoallomurus liliacearum TaxID=1080073 RepID=A0ABP8TQ53_9ACTN
MRPEGPAADRGSAVRSYELPDASVGGNGLRPEAAHASWADIRALACGGPEPTGLEAGSSQAADTCA